MITPLHIFTAAYQWKDRHCESGGTMWYFLYFMHFFGAPTGGRARSQFFTLATQATKKNKALHRLFFLLFYISL